MPMTPNYTVNPRLSPPPGGGGLFISSPFVGGGGGGLIEAGDLLEMGGLFNLEKTMVLPVGK